jgi:hypothetical protein
MPKAAEARGFKLVDPTIRYAFVPATGMVDNHTVDCFRRAGGRERTMNTAPWSAKRLCVLPHVPNEGILAMGPALPGIYGRLPCKVIAAP